jgi:hypothetical protein
VFAWIKSLFSRPNIIRVVDPLDDHSQDTAFPTEFAKMMGKIRSNNTPDSLDAALAEIPEKWIVFELGQTPAFLLWDCVLFQWDHDGESGRTICCCENDTALGAVRCCLSRLNGGKRLCSYECGK